MNVTTIQAHDCEDSSVEHTSTADKPYHYVGSGLGNVYLVGVKYWVCAVCKQQAANIPQLGRLLGSIARTLVEKASPMTGEQVRFLRKRTGKSSKEFAALVGVTAERYSVIESSATPVSEGRDKLVRFVYRVFSGDKKLQEALVHMDKMEQWLLALHKRDDGECILGTWLGARSKRWRVEEATLAQCA